MEPSAGAQGPRGCSGGQALRVSPVSITEKLEYTKADSQTAEARLELAGRPSQIREFRQKWTSAKGIFLW